MPSSTAALLPERYDAWFDPALPDLIALKASEMTPALREQLAREQIEVRSVEASSLFEAVRTAFPERFNHDEGRTLNEAFNADGPTVRTVAISIDRGTSRVGH